MTNRIDDLQAEISGGDGAAKTNMWRVTLPALGGYSTRGLNLLCRSAQTPGRNINQTELTIGLNRKQIANGYGVTPITMSFLVLNDPYVLEYFEKWQSLMVNQETYEVGYYTDYIRTVKIDVLKKGTSYPVFNKSFDLKIPSFIKNSLPNIGPINFRQGEIDIDISRDDKVIYSYELLDAYPNSFIGVNLANEPGAAFMELSVTMTYRDFKSSYTRTTEESKIKGFTEKVVDNAIAKLASKFF